MLFLNHKNLNHAKQLTEKVKLKAKNQISEPGSKPVHVMTNSGPATVTVSVSFVPVFIVAILALFSSNMLFAGKMVGTAHDFASKGFDAGENCIICHTPHNSDISITITPLWNHQISSSTYDMYFTNNENINTQPTGASKLCLSCHDGVTAIDKFGGRKTVTYMDATAAQQHNSSNKQTDSHPVSITFDSAMADANPSLYDPAVRRITIGAGGGKTRTGTIAELLLSNGKVQCSSCHDVHNNYVGANMQDQPFLKVTTSGSKICLTCHNK